MFWRSRIGIESRDIFGDEFKSGLRILRYVDAQLQGSAQEVSVHLFFGGAMAEAQDHHFVVVAI